MCVCLHASVSISVREEERERMHGLRDKRVCGCVGTYLGVASVSPVLIILAKKQNVLSEESD